MKDVRNLLRLRKKQMTLQGTTTKDVRNLCRQKKEIDDSQFNI